MTGDCDVGIRAASAEDAPVLARLQDEARGGGWVASRWKQELRRSNTVVWLAEPDDVRQPVGYLAMWRVLDRLEVVDVAVHPDWRRRGIATAMLEMAMTLGQARGIRWLTLEVRRDNRAARRLYEQRGLEVIEKKPDFYEDGQTALVMGRRLDSDR